MEAYRRYGPALLRKAQREEERDRVWAEAVGQVAQAVQEQVDKQAAGVQAAGPLP